MLNRLKTFSHIKTEEIKCSGGFIHSVTNRIVFSKNKTQKCNSSIPIPTGNNRAQLQLSNKSEELNVHWKKTNKIHKAQFITRKRNIIKNHWKFVFHFIHSQHNV